MCGSANSMLMEKCHSDSKRQRVLVMPDTENIIIIEPATKSPIFTVSHICDNRKIQFLSTVVDISDAPARDAAVAYSQQKPNPYIRD